MLGPLHPQSYSFFVPVIPPRTRKSSCCVHLSGCIWKSWFSSLRANKQHYLQQKPFNKEPIIILRRSDLSTALLDAYQHYLLAYRQNLFLRKSDQLLPQNRPLHKRKLTKSHSDTYAMCAHLCQGSLGFWNPTGRMNHSVPVSKPTGHWKKALNSTLRCDIFYSDPRTVIVGFSSVGIHNVLCVFPLLHV